MNKKYQKRFEIVVTNVFKKKQLFQLSKNISK
jgi:hypothetical protein